MHRIVIRTVAAAAQHDVRVFIARGVNHGDLATKVDTEKTMRLRYGFERVDRNGKTAVSAIFETHRRAQTARHFAVRLRFGGACANRGPGDAILQILW